MKILSSFRIAKIILTLLWLIFLSNIHAEEQDLLLLPSQKSSQSGLSTSQIVEVETNPYDSILEFLNSSTFPNRKSFPRDFFFGVGSSAAQIEEASHDGGRGFGIFDEIVKNNKDLYRDADKFPSKIEHCKRYKEDVQHIKKLGVNSYRFSISWSRILPDGTIKGGINKEGVNFYNNLINELLKHGIDPFVTILHFDYPLALQQKFGGFLNRSIVKHYKDYCELLFKTYGDRVKHWTTFNEPVFQIVYEYILNVNDFSIDKACSTNRICTKAYSAFHNILIAHATISKLYRTKFQEIQEGEIGISITAEVYVPYSSKLEDVDAAQRLSAFTRGWVLEPLIYGNYPPIMRKILGKRLPKFTRKEKEMLKESTNFIGINYYTSKFVRNEPNKTKINGFYNFEALAVKEDFNAEGKTLGYLDQYGGGCYVYPDGLYDFLLYTKEKYNNPKVYITENGIISFKIPNPLKDEHRTAYIGAHINTIKAAIDEGIDVRGYFAWAAFDTYEYIWGYANNNGLFHIDFNDNLKRIPTNAARWYTKYLTYNLVS